MNNKKTLWAGALVVGAAVTLCCVAPLGLIPLALVSVAGSLRSKFSRTKTAKAQPNSIASVAAGEVNQKKGQSQARIDDHNLNVQALLSRTSPSVGHSARNERLA